VLGHDDKVFGEGFDVEEFRDVQQDSPAEDGFNGVDGMTAEAFGIGLDRGNFLASEEFAVAGEVTESVDVGADMGAERNGFGGGTGSAGVDVVAVFFVESVEERRVRRVMGDSSVERLGEVYAAAIAKGAE
jgi:hypothetical protein